MKTCIKYWGGKQQLADKIIASIPEHHCYCEPFFGGGAVFFAKSKSKVEQEAKNQLDNISTQVQQDAKEISIHFTK